MRDIEEIKLEMENNLLNFILRLLRDYMQDPGFKYCCSREDVVALIPHYLNSFIRSQNIITEYFEIDSDSFMMINGHKVYFTSPYKDSIIIFDKRYYKEAAIIKLPGKNEDESLEVIIDRKHGTGGVVVKGGTEVSADLIEWESNDESE